MSNENIFEFTAVVRGFHHYRRFWVPKSSQKLNCSYEPYNPFCWIRNQSLWRGVWSSSRLFSERNFSSNKFFIDRGANITVTLTSDCYRRSPLVQGGMEIACKVTASILGTCINLLLVERYKKLLEDNYTGPKKEEILGSYLNQHEEKGNQDPREIVRKRKEKIPKKKEVKTKDIYQFFSSVSTSSTAAMRNDKTKRKHWLSNSNWLK